MDETRTSVGGSADGDDDFGQAVIQRLFAVGLELRLALGFTNHPQAAQRLHRAVTELENAISDIQRLAFNARFRGTDAAVPRRSDVKVG